MTAFEINQTVEIRDPNSFYFGRTGVVADRAIYTDAEIYTVHVPSETGNATISCTVTNPWLRAL